MQSSLYSHVSTRQPCTPSSSCAVPPRTAAPKLGCSRTANLQYRSRQHTYGEPVTPVQRVRHGCVPRATASSSMFSDPQPMHQHQHHIPAPEWHPRLFGIKESKRAAMEHAARLYYGEVWAGGSLDLLDELAAAGVCFNDALGMEADAFSRASLKSIIQEFQASHPLLKFDLVSGMCWYCAGLMSHVLALSCLTNQPQPVCSTGTSPY